LWFGGAFFVLKILLFAKINPMIEKILSSKKFTYPFFLFLVLITFALYTGAGIFGREVLKDTTLLKGWTSNTGNKVLDVWASWDSGNYLLIASQGYPDLTKVDYRKTYIEVPPESWIKVFLGYAEIGPDHEILPFSTEIPYQNVVFLINSSDLSKEVPFHYIQPGIPYCSYSGPIEYIRDVKPDGNFAKEQGGVSYITYYDTHSQKIIFKEEFYANSFNNDSTVIFGEKRPEGIPSRPYEGFGCEVIQEKDVFNVPFKPYIKSVSPFPFMPLYPFLMHLANNIFSNLLLWGVIISNLSLFLGAIFLYELLSILFSKKFGFYATLFYLISPLSFLFRGVMTESLFNLLLFGSLFCALKGKYILASLLFSLMSITRIPGILFGGVLIILFVRKFSGKKLVFSLLSLASIGPAFLLGHVYRLYKLTGNWFVILEAQQAFGRVEKGLIESLFGYFKYGMPYAPFEFVFFGFSLGVIIWFLRAYYKEKGELFWECSLHSLYSFVIPISSGAFTSFPRYILTIFPFFVAFGWFLDRFKGSKWVVFVGSLVLSLIGMVFWSVGSRFIM